MLTYSSLRPFVMLPWLCSKWQKTYEGGEGQLQPFSSIINFSCHKLLIELSIVLEISLFKSPKASRQQESLVASKPEPMRVASLAKERERRTHSGLAQSVDLR